MGGRDQATVFRLQKRAGFIRSPVRQARSFDPRGLGTEEGPTARRSSGIPDPKICHGEAREKERITETKWNGSQHERRPKDKNKPPPTTRAKHRTKEGKP